MTIIDNSSPLTTFSRLEVGDIFRDLVDNDIMMKINPVTEDRTNAISLKDGEGYDLDACQEVMRIDATLTIH